MIVFLVAMGVVFTAVIATGVLCWLTALVADPIDKRIWAALGRGSNSSSEMIWDKS